jgi:acetyl esterase
MREEFIRLREERYAKLSPAKREWLMRGPASGLRALGVEGMRQLGRDMSGPPQVAQGVALQDVVVPGRNGPIPTRIYRPEATGPLGVHLHLHAGGYIMFGGLDAEVTRLSNMARDTGCIVVAPDFRLPPEHKFPTPVEDCWDTADWLGRNCESFGGDPDRIGVGGGCTGGALSAAIAIMARDAGAPRFKYLYLSASVTDLRMGYRSYLELEEGYTLCADGMRYVSDVFIRDELDRFDWRASPILAPSLRGLPRTMIINGEWDVLRDESQAFGDRLRDAGVEVSVTLIPEEGHTYSPEAAPGVQKLFHQFVRDTIGTPHGQADS